METSRFIIPKELLVLQCGSGSEQSGWEGGREGERTPRWEEGKKEEGR